MGQKVVSEYRKGVGKRKYYDVKPKESMYDKYIDSLSCFIETFLGECISTPPPPSAEQLVE